MDTKFLIYGCKQARPTGMMIANLMNCVYEEGKLTEDPNQFSAIFRYGNRMEYDPIYSGYRGVVINSLSSIKRASDKIECRRRLLNCGVPAPGIYDLETMYTITKFPVIARPFFHMGGKRFYLANNIVQAKKFLSRNFYLQDIIEKKKEYRLFIWKDRIVEAAEKVPIIENPDPLVRNHRRGWGFQRTPISSIETALKNAARMAAKSVEIDWCAVDCCIANDNTPYVFEVNSAPGLIERKVQRLVLELKSFLGRA